mmetsp:Transcript_11074/g.33659  ORF Transcript_11074/g.33659 Transcript_11074/m.33659 type:complete len:255 (+) Transcript_11074:211-975(+)
MEMAIELPDARRALRVAAGDAGGSAAQLGIGLVVAHELLEHAGAAHAAAQHALVVRGEGAAAEIDARVGASERLHERRRVADDRAARGDAEVALEAQGSGHSVEIRGRARRGAGLQRVEHAQHVAKAHGCGVEELLVKEDARAGVFAAKSLVEPLAARRGARLRGVVGARRGRLGADAAFPVLVVDVGDGLAAELRCVALMNLRQELRAHGAKGLGAAAPAIARADARRREQRFSEGIRRRRRVLGLQIHLPEQ